MSTVRDLSGRAPSSRRKFRRLGVEERERVDDTAALLDGAEHDARDHSTALTTAVLNDLSDVGGTPSADQILTFDGTSWGPGSGASLDAIQDGDTLTWHEGAFVSVASGAYHTIFDLASATELLGGSIVGVNLGARLTIDGTVVYDRTASFAGQDAAGDTVSALTVLPAKADSSMKLELFAKSAAQTVGWKVVTR